MIISHKYKFIFLKTSKTAGTSLEIALSKFCGKEDIITPIGARDEQLRSDLGYRAPQNYLVPFGRYSLQDWKEFLTSGKKPKFYNHIGARQVKRLIPRRIWNEYYKFCFERNPWDRLISLYYWHYRQEESPPPISEFIDSGTPNALRKLGFEVYTIDGAIAVDKVFLYEKLQEKLEELGEELRLPDKLSLPRAKGNYRKDERHYRDILSSDDKEKIGAMFCKEIALFGYHY